MKKAKPAAKAAPETTVATLSGEQFNTLLRHEQGVRLAQIELQRQMDEIQAKREAYYGQLAAQYHLPATFSAIAFDERTLKIAVKP